MPIPLTSRDVADGLEQRIRSGEIPAGTKLPTYAQMYEMFGIGYTSAARVSLMLRERGLVHGVAGRGVFVRDDIPPA